MDRASVIERVEQLARVDADAGSDAPAIEAALVAARQLTAWVAARQALDDRRRTELFDRVDTLADVAAAATVDEFRSRRAQRCGAACTRPDRSRPHHTHYDRCELHHIIWWRHGGPTDLANLIPLCSRHHSNIHHHEWVITLGPNRELTSRLPDGTVQSTGPPTIRAA